MGRVQKAEFSASDVDQVDGKALADYAIEYVFRPRVPETLDHD
jgi:hypothetical protein